MNTFGVHRYIVLLATGYMDLWNFGPLAKGGIRRTVMYSEIVWC